MHMEKAQRGLFILLKLTFICRVPCMLVECYRVKLISFVCTTTQHVRAATWILAPDANTREKNQPS